MFAGVVCITDGAKAAGEAARAVPPGHFPDWMDTSDGHQGFRKLFHFPAVALAVAKPEEDGACRLRPDFEYTCPPGYRWAKKAQVCSIESIHMYMYLHIRAGACGNRLPADICAHVLLIRWRCF